MFYKKLLFITVLVLCGTGLWGMEERTIQDSDQEELTCAIVFRDTSLMLVVGGVSTVINAALMTGEELEKEYLEALSSLSVDGRFLDAFAKIRWVFKWLSVFTSRDFYLRAALGMLPFVVVFCFTRTGGVVVQNLIVEPTKAIVMGAAQSTFAQRLKESFWAFWEQIKECYSNG